MSRVILGPRAVVEALRGRASSVHAVFVCDGARGLDEVNAAAKRAGARIEERTREELDALADGGRHRSVLAIAGAYPYRDLDEILAARAGGPALILALDQITDPHNFGAIVRSAVAFEVDAITIMKKRAVHVTPVVVRASAGATEHAAICKVTNLARTLRTLRARGMEIVGLAAEGEVDIGALGPPPEEGRVLVLGAEGAGPPPPRPRELRDARADRPAGPDRLAQRLGRRRHRPLRPPPRGLRLPLYSQSLY